MNTQIRLSRLSVADEAAILFLRMITGAFLVYGVWDNIVSADRMDEFVRFLRAHNFIFPVAMARISVWAQFFCGIAFVTGALFRLAGLICALNFLIAVWMVHWPQDLRGWWPALVLVGLGLLFAARGAGRISVDAIYHHYSSGTRSERD